MESSLTGGRVRIVGAPPAFYAGISRILRESGFDVDDTPPTSDGPSHEASGQEDEILMVVVHDHHVVSENLAAIRESSTSIVAVPWESESMDPAMLIQMGASAVIPAQSPPHSFAAAIIALRCGFSVLPATVLREWAAGVRERGESMALSVEERRWLRLLSEGHAVAAIAPMVGYSERSMYRLLDQLYGRLGIATRSEAVAWAARRGLLDAKDI